MGKRAHVVEVEAGQWVVVSGGCHAVSSERVVRNGWGEQEVEHWFDTEAEAIEAAVEEGWEVVR